MTADHIYTIAGIGGLDTGDGALAPDAELGLPVATVVDAQGDRYVAETSDRIRFVPAESGTYFGRTMTANDIYDVAGSGTAGFAGDGGPASAAEFNGSDAIAVDAKHDLFIADADNERVRFVPAASGTYFGRAMTADDIYTIAGTGTAGFSGDGGPAAAAELSLPTGVAVDGHGDLYVSDLLNNAIRFVPSNSGTYYGRALSAGDIYTIAGDGTLGFSGDGGPATAAQLGLLQSGALVVEFPALQLGVDSHGNVAIPDQLNGRVRLLANSAGTYFGQAMAPGDIYTVAGDGTPGYTGDGGPGTSAELGLPVAVAAGGSGTLYVTDYLDARVRSLTP
jgi:hypothetical protein